MKVTGEVLESPSSQKEGRNETNVRVRQGKKSCPTVALWNECLTSKPTQLHTPTCICLWFPRVHRGKKMH